MRNDRSLRSHDGGCAAYEKARAEHGFIARAVGVIGAQRRHRGRRPHH
jgi:hypothetical protein